MAEIQQYWRPKRDLFKNIAFLGSRLNDSSQFIKKEPNVGINKIYKNIVSWITLKNKRYKQ